MKVTGKPIILLYTNTNYHTVSILKTFHLPFPNFKDSEIGLQFKILGKNVIW